MQEGPLSQDEFEKTPISQGIGCLAPGGVLLILTTMFPNGKESYGRQCISEDCYPKHKFITRHEFNSEFSTKVEF